jgi:pimeloyl-ACP methyl ester carboxylesterase
MHWARLPGLGEALYGSFYAQNIGERLYLNFVDPSLVTQRVVDEVEKQMRLEGAVAAALAAARGMRFADSQAEYRNIQHPTLLLWGREDRVARLSFGERLARELPHAHLVVLPRCGHIPMWECSGETAAALTEFLSAK